MPQLLPLSFFVFSSSLFQQPWLSPFNVFSASVHRTRHTNQTRSHWLATTGSHIVERWWTPPYVPRTTRLHRLQAHFSTPSSTFSSHYWWFWAQRSKPFKMVSLVTMKLVRVVARFYVKTVVFRPNDNKFQHGTLKILHALWDLWNGTYIAYVWCRLQKITFFESNCQKFLFDFVSFYVQGQLELKIKFWNHPWIRFNTMSPMTVLDLENEVTLKIIFFEVSLIVSICVNFQ